MKKLEEALIKALKKYNGENIDIYVDSMSKACTIMYHDRHNSYPIDTGIHIDTVSEKDLDILCVKYNVGYVVE